MKNTCRECRRCLNNDTVRHIEYDNDGVCNFCNSYDEVAIRLGDQKKLEKLFKNRVAKIKGKHAYDAVVGISGGKDSVYVLHQLINKYHLKVRAFTLDNGFFTTEARKNVDRIVRDFDVEHEYVEFDPKFLKEVYHYSMSHFLTPCVACSYLGYVSMINYAMRHDAGFCIQGRSPEQMLRSYGNDVFSRFIDLGLKDINEIDINKEYLKILDDVAQKISPKLARQIKVMLYEDTQDDNLRELVPYFLYHPYDEAKIVEFLQKETTWRPPKEYNHFDCKVHNAAKYIYQTAEGRPHRLPETSVRVRRGEISKEAGREILAKEIIEKPKDELKYLCEFAKINQSNLLLKARTYNWINRHRGQKQK